MAEFTIQDEDLRNLRGKVIIVTGTSFPPVGDLPTHVAGFSVNCPRLTTCPASFPGGSSGIGLTTVELLLGLGAAVVSGDAQPPAAPQVIYPSEGSAAFFTYIPTDISVWADLVQLFKRAIQVHGRVDHVFANAGVPSSLGNYFSSLSLDADGELQEPSHAVLEVNLKGTINTATLAIHHMQTQEPPGGSVVLNCSITSTQRPVGDASGKFRHSIHSSLSRPRLPPCSGRVS